MKRSIREGVGFENDEEEISKWGSHVSTHSSAMDLKIVVFRCDKLFMVSIIRKGHNVSQ